MEVIGICGALIDMIWDVVDKDDVVDWMGCRDRRLYLP